MSIKVALHHHTSYVYDRPIKVGPQVIRLRPAPHCRTPIESYSLRVTPEDHFINWQQDPHGNFLARIVFEKEISHLTIDVDLVVNMSVINPFDFFVEADAENHPFEYKPEELIELKPYLVTEPVGKHLAAFLETIDHDHDRTIDFLVNVNQLLEKHIDYVVRMEPGVQSCEETLEKKSGSCRDSAWLLVQILRQLGLAARFTSGYLIQLKPDVKSLDGPSGTNVDFTDLHAWTEVFLPGAGWVGLDPTSGLLTGEGHLPLASTPKFTGAAAITGALEECETEFDFGMTVARVHEDPRVTKPYTEEQWNAIDKLGYRVDDDLKSADVRLTMGGEPTFVSIDNPDDPQWQTEAIGEEKNRLANDLMARMKKRFGENLLMHYGQGKWYPGEPIPRWAKTCYARKDGLPIWKDPSLFASEGSDHGHSTDDAQRFAAGIAGRLGVDDEDVADVFEDALYHLWEEQRLPVDVDLGKESMRDSIDRKRLAKVLEQGLQNPVGAILPLMYDRNASQPKWISGPWKTRTDRINLIPGDSPVGYRLPLNSLATISDEQKEKYEPLSPVADRGSLPDPAMLRVQNKLQHSRRSQITDPPEQVSFEKSPNAESANSKSASSELVNTKLGNAELGSRASETALMERDTNSTGGDAGSSEVSNGSTNGSSNGSASCKHDSASNIGTDNPQVSDASGEASTNSKASTKAIPFALCVEARNGTLSIFMPPTDRLEQYLEILAAVEDTASELNLPVLIEGYKPPSDHRLKSFSITPDPGVIEVNVQPAESWDELKEITEGLYGDAYQSRLGTEKFELDGNHTGTGGGNHVVLGGPTPLDSPMLRRPDLLRSLVGFWQNHPSLSYLFSSRFVGSTSQAPRVDEGRTDALYELQIAFDELDRQMASPEGCPPHLADRLFRNLLIDLTGNTHRAEFCIDKLYSPDSSTGRLGLLEFRGFEMPPHERMSLTQQLLIRTLVAQFWKNPYTQPLVDWKTRLHDQFMLPSFIWRDFCDVAATCQLAGYDVQADWFKPHFEFRFPFIGRFEHNTVQVELRQAIEPWNVLGEETTGTGTSRYVDSSVEKMEVKVSGYVDERYVVTCNGRALPFHPTETKGEYVAGVRYRAWQPPSCLHPTIPVDGPLTFDLYDQWLGRSVSGCRYHVGHPGGLNPTTLPVNSYEAESRRAARFSKIGHSGTNIHPRKASINPEFPMTLDLRKDRH
ncbi:MAG: transglutaminase family protein [Mariniblastus sp.]